MIREIKPNTKYKHFKNDIYIVENISTPTIISEEIKKNYFYKAVIHTENNNNVFIYKLYDKKYNNFIYIHNNETCSDELVIYSKESNPNLMYGRPKEMFLSEVDHEKYPNISQKYRFEKIL